jgi:hypothetical protein
MVQIRPHQPPWREGPLSQKPTKLTEYWDLLRSFQIGYRASDRREYSGFRLGVLEVTSPIIIAGDVH